MNVNCPSCQTRYQVDDARVPPSGVSIRCPSCGHAFVAKPPPAAVPLPGSAAPQPPSAVPLPGRSPDDEVTQLAGPGPEDFTKAEPRPKAPDLSIPLPGAPIGDAPDRSAPSPAPAPQRAARPTSTGLTITRSSDLDFGPSRDLSPPAAEFDSLDLNIENPEGLSGSIGHVTDDLEDLELNLDRDAETPAMLDFIDQAKDQTRRSKDGASAGAFDELRVRRLDGRVEGPYGVGRISAMLRNGDLRPIDEASADGVSWEPLSRLPQFQAAVAAAPARRPTQAGALDFGQVVLSADGPPLEAEQPRQPSRVDLAGEIAASIDIPDTPRADPIPAPRENSAAAAELEAELQVPDAPKAPSAKRRLRPALLAGGLAVVAAAAGGVMYFSSSGPETSTPEPRKAPTTAGKRPARPRAQATPAAPSLSTKEQLLALREGDLKAQADAISALSKEKLSPDQALSFAEGAALSALRYGRARIPLAPVEAAVKALSTLDPAKLLGGDLNASGLARLKAEAALSAAQGRPATAQAAALIKQAKEHPEDPTIPYLQAALQPDRARALASLDRALVLKLDPAVMAAVAARIKKDDPKAAAAWLLRGNALDPRQADLAFEAAALLRGLKQIGAARRAEARAAAHAKSGLLPAERGALMLRIAETADAWARLPQTVEPAQEAARLLPKNDTAQALGAAAWASRGPEAAKEALSTVNTRAANKSLALLLAQVRVYGQLGDLERAEDSLARARRIAPKDPRPDLREGLLRLQFSEEDRAVEPLTRAMKAAEKDPSPAIALAQVQLKAGRLKEAEAAATRALKIAPKDARAQNIVGRVALARGDAPAAGRAFRAALRLDEAAVAPRLGLAQALVAQGTSASLAEAETQLIRLLIREPRDAGALLAYGELLQRRHLPQRALESFQRAATLNPDALAPHLKVMEAALDHRPPALDTAKEALKAAKRAERRSGHLSPELDFWRGRVAFAAGDLHTASAALSSAVRKAPEIARYHFWLGRARAKNAPLEANSSFEEALKLDPKLNAATRELGRVAMSRFRYKEARRYFSRYRAVAPKDASIYVDIGDSYQLQNRDDEALKAYLKAVKQDPRLALVQFNIGQIYNQREARKPALKHFRLATRADPSFGPAWCQIGISLSERRRNSEGTAALRRCISLASSPEDMRTTAQELLSE